MRRTKALLLNSLWKPVVKHTEVRNLKRYWAQGIAHTQLNHIKQANAGRKAWYCRTQKQRDPVQRGPFMGINSCIGKGHEHKDSLGLTQLLMGLCSPWREMQERGRESWGAAASMKVIRPIEAGSKGTGYTGLGQGNDSLGAGEGEQRWEWRADMLLQSDPFTYPLGPGSKSLVLNFKKTNK